MPTATETALTTEQYDLLQRAFDHFNNTLYGGELPNVLITVARKAKTKGYFWADRYTSKGSGEVIHEIALNPDFFQGDDVAADVLSTLVHEMAHLWQEAFGEKKPRKAYHNREWANKMKAVGLIPSNTGMPGGKQTGQKMTHYIDPDGVFEKSCHEFLKEVKPFLIEAILYPVIPKETKNSKVPYICEKCGSKAWAKPETLLKCGRCDEPMESQE